MRILRPLSVTFVLLWHCSTWAAVSAQLSQSSIDELETVNLIIRISDTRASQTLDLSALESDFHVMGTNTSSQSRFINGRGTSWVDYRITLQPKRTGTFKIPSIKVGAEQTPTLQLVVNPLSPNTRKIIDEKVFFEQEVSQDTIYVQGQLVVTRRLLYLNGVQLYNDLPGAPEITDAVVLTLGETISGTTQRHGQTYGVVQQRYAIFPETSGTLKVPGISVTASVRLLEQGRTSRKGVRVGTQDQLITVLPVPTEYPADQPWLPAENVRLLAVVSPQRASYEVGDTLTHELLIHIEGNIGSAAPPLPLEINEDEFRVYPEPPVLEDDTNAETVKGSRLQTAALVPQTPGTLEISTNEIVWWDTVNKQVRRTTTQPMVFDITGTAVVPIKTPDSSSTQTTAQSIPNASEDIAAEQPNQRVWYLLAIVFVTGILAVTLYIYRRGQRGTGENPSIQSVHIDPRDGFEQAFKDKDLGGMVSHANSILAAHYQCSKVDAFKQFQIAEPDAAALLTQMSRAVYGAGTQEGSTTAGSVNAAELRSALNRLSHSRTEISDTPSALPPLYPNAF